jgi:capsular polysaccharide biosynthesis protein
MPKGETWQFKHLIVPSLSNHNDGVITPGLAPWTRMLKNILNIKSKTKRRIFISRDDARSRKVLNTEKLLMALKGWETIILEGMSMREQVRYFSEASHIVTTHGAGLVNLLWCDPGTKVIEIQDIKKIDKKVYPVLSHHLDLEHKIHLAKTIPMKLSGPKPKGTKNWQMVNFEINIPDLMRQID